MEGSVLLKRPGGSASFAERRPVAHHLYFAFLSYSHDDAETADWLHRELEDFRVPHQLVGRLTENGPIPRRLTPIFRDRQELAVARDLGDEIREALASSRFLLVLCSPTAAASKWTNAEVDTFKSARPDGCVLAAILDGEPFASEVSGREAEECLPPALRVQYDRRGRPTRKRAEPLAADLRDSGDGRRLAFLKIVAGMLGVGLDELIQRETVRKHRRLATLTAASMLGTLVASALAVTAIEGRDEARAQRREAESLIGFMLGDLRSKLEPVGRLDALDGVGARVLAYYQKQDTADLSDAALSQRSRALNLMAGVAKSRGDSGNAARLYRVASLGTAEAMRRDPDDPQRIFDHAQNVFYLAEIARGRGELDSAEAKFREYKALAGRMVALQPDNMKWRMEGQYADANLGIVLFNQRRFDEAARRLEQALRTIEAFAAVEPGNREYQRSVAESLAWLADSQGAAGRFDQAIQTRQRHIALLERLLGQDGDVAYRSKLVPAYRALGNLYGQKGQLDLAVANMRKAGEHSAKLLEVEPGNTEWRDFASRAQLDLARYLLEGGNAGEARGAADTACASYTSMLARDATVPLWRAGLRECFNLRARLALASGDPAAALALSGQAVATARSVKSTDSATDAYALARSMRLLGDIRRRLRDDGGAREAWSAALAALPRGVTERPWEMNERAELLRRLGRAGEARELSARLRSMGYEAKT